MVVFTNFMPICENIRKFPTHLGKKPCSTSWFIFFYSHGNMVGLSDPGKPVTFYYSTVTCYSML